MDYQLTHHSLYKYFNIRFSPFRTKDSHNYLKIKARYHKKLFLLSSIILLLLALFTKIMQNVPGMFPNLILAPHSLKLLLKILVEISIGISLNLF